MSPVSNPHSRIKLNSKGVEGDSHAGLMMKKDGIELPNTRQVSLVSVEELQEISGELDIEQIKPDWIGANILVSGIPNLSKLPKGTKLKLQNGAVIIVEEANTACASAGRAVQAHYSLSHNIGSRFPKAAIGKRGLLAWVEQAGNISVGDTVTLYLPG
ncbi:MAG: MOSC domain-containing protein [Chloroflexota bacterium]